MTAPLTFEMIAVCVFVGAIVQCVMSKIAARLTRRTHIVPGITCLTRQRTERVNRGEASRVSARRAFLPATRVGARSSARARRILCRVRRVLRLDPPTLADEFASLAGSALFARCLDAELHRDHYKAEVCAVVAAIIDGVREACPRCQGTGITLARKNGKTRTIAENPQGAYKRCPHCGPWVELITQFADAEMDLFDKTKPATYADMQRGRLPAMRCPTKQRRHTKGL